MLYENDIPDYVVAIVERANMEYHIYNCHPSWVDYWEWLSDETLSTPLLWTKPPESG